MFLWLLPLLVSPLRFKAHKISAYLFRSGTLRAIALYPLNALTKARDISFSRNLPGIMSNVRPAPGPDGRRGTSYEFLGRKNSFIYFPNNGKLDAKNSITILAWVNSQAQGPIFHFHPKAWGVHFWMVGSSTISVRFTKRRTRDFTAALASKTVKRGRWQFIGASYDQPTGMAKLFVGGRLVAKKRIGRIRLATNYPARMGAIKNDRRYFRGKISCLQVYKVALNARQILRRRNRCFVKGNWST